MLTTPCPPTDNECLTFLPIDSLLLRVPQLKPIYLIHSLLPVFQPPKGTAKRSPARMDGLSTITCSSEEVASIIQSLKVKSASGPDGISTQMLKICSSFISQYLSLLFNQSLSSGIVPTDWKLSNVTPVYKAGDPKLAENYRPISLLSFPSKLLERIVHNRLLKYLLENDHLSPSQFGFRPFSSTQEALITATNDWHQYLDCGIDTASIFFDLSKAFDVLPHSVILDALDRVGVHGPLYSWFESYLTGRSQRVVLDVYTSQTVCVSSGVPQGSILGPLLFILAMNPLTNVSLSTSTHLILYADDILVYKPIRCYLDRVALQNDVNIIVDWIDSTGLRLNPTKTKLMIFSRRLHPMQLQITVANSAITQVTSIKYLGVTVTSNLSWSAHIDNTCVKARKQLGLPFPSCWQEGFVQTVQVYCSAPARLLCLCVGSTSGYQDPKTGGGAEICCQAGHWPVAAGLSGSHPTH